MKLTQLVLAIAIITIGCSTEGQVREANTATPSNTGENQPSEPGETAATATHDSDELVSFDGLGFKIFAYEASVTDGEAYSIEGVVPTVSINYETAKSACEASGYRLCTWTEWFKACKGPDDLAYGFSDTHENDTPLSEQCDVARTTNNSPGSLPSATGSHADCQAKDFAIFDMIGNASEWVDSDGTPLAAGVAFYQTEQASKCEATLTGGGSTMAPGTKSTDLGFRCCTDE